MMTPTSGSRRVKRCVNCGAKLKAPEVAANYDNRWFACFPCWDKSEGFSGWLTDLTRVVVYEALERKGRKDEVDSPQP